MWKPESLRENETHKDFETQTPAENQRLTLVWKKLLKK